MRLSECDTLGRAKEHFHASLCFLSRLAQYLLAIARPRQSSSLFWFTITTKIQWHVDKLCHKHYMVRFRKTLVGFRNKNNCHLFKPSKTDADCFTMQVHYNLCASFPAMRQDATAEKQFVCSYTRTAVKHVVAHNQMVISLLVLLFLY